jgi:hypothetical protein
VVRADMHAGEDSSRTRNIVDDAFGWDAQNVGHARAPDLARSGDCEFVLWFPVDNVGLHTWFQ